MSVKSFLDEVTGPANLPETDTVSVAKEAEEDFFLTFVVMSVIGGGSLLASLYFVIGAVHG